jgi:NRAMP (natural resistance-associated macrophage protein)-like metal ion transporter
VEAARFPAARWWAVLGPGLVAGATDDDPSGVATYAVAGASLGFATLWTALVTTPMIAAVQFMSAKIGLVTGYGLAGVLRRHYPRWMVSGIVLGLAVANTINAGADIGAVAAALNLLVPVPIALMIISIAVLLVIVEVWGSYRLFAGALKWMCFALFSYVASGLLARPDWREVLIATFVPRLSFDTAFLTVLVAVLGTTFSPYEWFWQASQEVEERLAIGQGRAMLRRGSTPSELRYAAWDVTTGMVISNVVMYFIIAATASTLHRAGHTNISSAAQAAEALRPFAGRLAFLLFAVGVAAVGLIAIPVLTASAAYAVADLFGWHASLTARPRRAKWFYAAIVLSTGIGMLINFTGINPIDALFITAVINGFLTPPVLFFLMLASNNRAILGDRANTPLLNVIGWVSTAVTTAAVIGLLMTWRP